MLMTHVTEARPTKGGLYIVDSSYGITVAHFILDWGTPHFQDVLTQNDEGELDFYGEVAFTVYAWASLPTTVEF